MPMSVRALPVVQSWDCHSCTNCCRDYVVHVTDDERQRILEQKWDQEPDLANIATIERTGWLRRGAWRLAHRDGGCVFLGEGGLCRIHAKFGAAAKPLACRLYPFILVPFGDHWRVGLRFACPSVTSGDGRPINQHLPDVREYARILEKQQPASQSATAPPLQGKQRVSWDDLDTFVEALAAVMSQRNDRIELRLRKCLALAQLCRQAKFDKIAGKRLEEFLSLVIESLDTEVAADPNSLPAPSRIGRLLFRQHLALAMRKDHGPEAGVAKRGRLALFSAAVRFARGAGTVPLVHGAIPETTFEKMEEPTGPWPDECEEMLERYYLTKLHSMQFAGLANFNASFWNGFESLVLTYPAIAWLTRAFTDRPKAQAMARAIRIIDDSFGYQPLLGNARQSFALRILSFRGELPRLVAWYSR